MANALAPLPLESLESEGPVSSVGLRQIRCAGCGNAVDPLRAGQVAFVDGRFHYFCHAECRQAQLRALGPPPEEGVETVRPPTVELRTGPAPSTPSLPPSPIDAGEAPPSEPSLVTARSEAPPSVRRPASKSAPAPEAQAPSPPVLRPALIGASLDLAGMGAGVLVPAIGLLGPAVAMARLPLAWVSAVALVVRVARVERDPADPHPVVTLVPALAAMGAASWAAAAGDPHAGSLVVFAALACAVGLAVEVLVGRARRGVAETRQRIVRALRVNVRAVRGDETVERPVTEVRPGEQVVVEAGEVVGVDAVVTAGEARVVPWLGAATEVVRREGDSVLAGARVSTNRLRMTTTWSGTDRAWVKLIASPATRIEVASPTSRAVRHLVERGAPFAAFFAAAAAFAANLSPIEVFAAACAGAFAFAAKAACSIAAVQFARAHLEALRMGIVYKDARAFERAASATVAVLSSRGAVLAGEPEIVAVEPLGSFEPERVLALAAGAEAVSTHPCAAAVLRAARVRGVRPDPVRNGAMHVGLGVTALASSGERLVVGGRAILLKEKIGAAVADQRIAELEAMGRSVLLVALGDRLVGLIALQDRLCSGARAAVQRLLDARVEPVLLSGEARETCETIGRALDIEHVRPEVLPADRGAVVRSLAEGGNVVAVIGHPARDDGALGAADVAVAMSAAGSTPREWAIVLAGDDVRDAAKALAIPHWARDRARVVAALGLAPGVVALLAIAFGVAPLALAPLAVLIGAASVAVYTRESAPPV